MLPLALGNSLDMGGGEAIFIKQTLETSGILEVPITLKVVFVPQQAYRYVDLGVMTIITCGNCTVIYKAGRCIRAENNNYVQIINVLST